MKSIVHSCGFLDEAVATTPPLLRPSRDAFAIPLHDGDGPGCLGASGIAVFFCPWSGEPLSDLPSNYQDWEPAHDCELMRHYLNIEDLVILRDESADIYLLPEFNGPFASHCLGTTGIQLLFCPWCGAALTSRGTRTQARKLSELRRALPAGTQSPRR